MSRRIESEGSRGFHPKKVLLPVMLAFGLAEAACVAAPPPSTTPSRPPEPGKGSAVPFTYEQLTSLRPDCVVKDPYGEVSELAAGRETFTPTAIQDPQISEFMQRIRKSGADKLRGVAQGLQNRPLGEPEITMLAATYDNLADAATLTLKNIPRLPTEARLGLEQLQICHWTKVISLGKFIPTNSTPPR